MRKKGDLVILRVIFECFSVIFEEIVWEGKWNCENSEQVIEENLSSKWWELDEKLIIEILD